jgi:hypothetical protein
VHVALPAAPTSVAAGAYSTCATTEGGELYCWGTPTTARSAIRR